MKEFKADTLDDDLRLKMDYCYLAGEPFKATIAGRYGPSIVSWEGGRLSDNSIKRTWEEINIIESGEGTEAHFIKEHMKKSQAKVIISLNEKAEAMRKLMVILDAEIQVSKDIIEEIDRYYSRYLPA